MQPLRCEADVGAMTAPRRIIPWFKASLATSQILVAWFRTLQAAYCETCLPAHETYSTSSTARSTARRAKVLVDWVAKRGMPLVYPCPGAFQKALTLLRR